MLTQLLDALPRPSRVLVGWYLPGGPRDLHESDLQVGTVVSDPGVPHLVSEVDSDALRRSLHLEIDDLLWPSLVWCDTWRLFTSPDLCATWVEASSEVVELSDLLSSAALEVLTP